ncbi:homeobox-like protein HDP1 [Chironomus tepperi]|uniref:homeobox-like protein HDP1 n=1 Tax=Chironomus tepperi TaxID=113505 RepID=UPI00391EFDFC
MLKTKHLLALLVLCFVSCDAREVNCPDSTRPHKTECNKYFKCIKLPSNSLSWITLTCQEGLIYDKNLRNLKFPAIFFIFVYNNKSCAIAPENWDCNLSSEVDDDDAQSGDSNKFENNKDSESVQTEANVEAAEDDVVRKESDEFLEIIDGDKDFGNIDATSRNVDDENSGEDTSESSGDDELISFVTPSSATASMITTQVQRLTQLVQNIPKRTSDISADDINSYLDTQKIQSNPPNHRYNSNGKTTVPADGKVHPEIESEIINLQNTLNSRLTTLPMGYTTPPTIKPMFYINKEPITEIKLKHGQGLEGIGTHQIVVNRPEGSVMFNVPATSDNTNKQNQPYLSQDILKTILELSKQMVSQKISSSQDNHQPTHPIYYAIPVPIVPPQSNVQNYYGQFPNQSMITTERPQVTNDIYQTTPQYKSPLVKNSYGELYTDVHPEIASNLGPYQAPPISNNNHHHHRHNLKTSQPISNQYGDQSYNVKSQQGNYQNYDPQQQYQQQYPSNNYSPYNPQNYQQYYNPQSYYQYSENNQYSPNPQNNFNQFSNYNGAYYGNRPFVSDSSAPFVDHTYNLQKNPYRKESFSSPQVSYGNDEYDVFHEESDDESEKFDDDLLEDESEEEKPKDATDGLICTYAVARQINQTDCFRYYVCNAKTKEVISYTCPEFTAFNDQTKYCDSSMYKECKKSQDRTTGSFKNKKYYAEAQKALQQAKRESQKVERIANMVKKQSQQIMYNRRNQVQNNYDQVEDVPNYYQQPQVQQAPVMQRPKQTKRTRPKSTKRVTVSKSNRRKSQPKKVKCITDGNIPDPNDDFSYWHCFKGTDGRMKRIHKRCTNNLRFCSDSRYCSPSC